MSVSRDDFSIASVQLFYKEELPKNFHPSLIILAIFIFFLDVYGFTLVKTEVYQ